DAEAAPSGSLKGRGSFARPAKGLGRGRTAKQRFADEVALDEGNAEVVQARELFGGFHAFGNNAHVQFFTQAGNGAHNRLPRLAGVDVAHQAHVDLENVGLKIGQQVQAGKACAEV